jgi:hypothetical protein
MCERPFLSGTERVIVGSISLVAAPVKRNARLTPPRCARQLAELAPACAADRYREAHPHTAGTLAIVMSLTRGYRLDDMMGEEQRKEKRVAEQGVIEIKMFGDEREAFGKAVVSEPRAMTQRVGIS